MDQNTSNMILAIVSVLSFSVSVFAAIVSVVVYRSQHAKELTVLVDLPKVVEKNTQLLIDKPGCVLITNSSLRPITLSKVDLVLTKGGTEVWSNSYRSTDTPNPFFQPLVHGATMQLSPDQLGKFCCQEDRYVFSVAIRDSEGQYYRRYKRGANWDVFSNFGSD